MQLKVHDKLLEEIKFSQKRRNFPGSPIILIITCITFLFLSSSFSGRTWLWGASGTRWWWYCPISLARRSRTSSISSDRSSRSSFTLYVFKHFKSHNDFNCSNTTFPPQILNRTNNIFELVTVEPILTERPSDRHGNEILLSEELDSVDDRALRLKGKLLRLSSEFLHCLRFQELRTVFLRYVNSGELTRVSLALKHQTICSKC